MKKMIRQLLCLIFFVSLLGSFADAEPIRIGVSTPLTGENAASGIDIKNAAIMANEELGDMGKMELFVPVSKKQLKLDPDMVLGSVLRYIMTAIQYRVTMLGAVQKRATA